MTPPKVLLAPKKAAERPLPNPGLTDSLTHRYEVQKLLGKSSFSEVFMARDRDLGRQVVIKFLNLSDRYEYVERFRREARLLASLKHPNIVQLFDFNVEGTKLYIIMEYIQGMELDAQNKLLRETSETQRIRWLCQAMRGICSALEYLHSQGIVHRDIKPSNILVDANGTPCLIDFGIARRVTGNDLITVNGELLGTVVYMSPEQAGGDTLEIDHRTDIYSMGVMLYHLLTDVLPFSGPNYDEILEQIRTATPVPPSTYNAAIPPVLDRIVLKALSRDKSARYASANAMMKDLLAIPKPKNSSRSEGLYKRIRIPLAIVLNVIALGFFTSDLWMGASSPAPQAAAESKFMLRESFRNGQMGPSLRTLAGETSVQPGVLTLINGSIETANAFSTEDELRVDMDVSCAQPDPNASYRVTLFSSGVSGFHVEWSTDGEGRLFSGDVPLASFRLSPMDGTVRRLTFIKKDDALRILENAKPKLEQRGVFTRSYNGTVEVWCTRGSLDLRAVRIEVK
jgi:serine/threonine protein kinase